jgi:glycyl-tRNA synthetase
VAGFTDPMVDCRACKARFRADKLDDAQCPRKPSRQPGAYADCDLTEPRLFNLMFKTTIGPVEDSGNIAYLRPETAQGIYVNFQNVQQASRQKVPFGIAQIGKAFRNEITPGNFIFRTREFEQMEMQFFVDPASDHMQWFEYWKGQRMEWHRSLGLLESRLHFHQHGEKELAHYARAAFDIEFDFGGSLGFQEIEGVHHRGDYDLSRHQEYSGKRMEYVDQGANRRYIPYVVETSAGADRTTLAVLVNAYREEAVPGEDEGRVVLGLAPSLAPLKAGVFPLVKKDGMPEFAETLARELRSRFPVFYDESGAIGRRYRRQDEVGTPFCLTIDGQTIQDGTVTVRDRDSLAQERIAADRVAEYLAQRVA